MYAVASPAIGGPFIYDEGGRLSNWLWWLIYGLGVITATEILRRRNKKKKDPKRCFELQEAFRDSNKVIKLLRSIPRRRGDH
jgi:hypothetical protein